MWIKFIGPEISIHEWSWARLADAERMNGKFGRRLLGPLDNALTKNLVYPNHDGAEPIYIHCVINNERGEILYWTDPVRVEPKGSVLFTFPVEGEIIA
jgi:hypothetical protein